MNLVIDSNFKELDFNELLAIDGGGYWTGFGAAVIGGAGIGVTLGSGGGPAGAAGGGIIGGIVGGLVYAF